MKSKNDYKSDYSKKLKDPRWQKKRLEILNRDNFTCTLCGDTKTELHVNHEKYCGNPWDSKNDDLTTLCKHCHSIYHTKPADEEIIKIAKEEKPGGNIRAYSYFSEGVRIYWLGPDCVASVMVSLSYHSIDLINQNKPS